MIDLIGYTALTALTVVIIASFTAYASGPALHRSILAGIAGLWTGFSFAAASAGWMARNEPFPLMGIFVATPLLLVLAAALHPAGRRVFASIPLQLMIGVNIGRIVALTFFSLEQAGRVAGPFPFFAGWGDILTGLAAIPLAVAVAASGTPSRRLVGAILAWNLFGTLDLLDAIFLGVTTSEGSALQLFHTPPGSAAMQVLPYAIVPSVLVPFYIAIHGGIWARLPSLFGEVRPDASERLTASR
jgi:hypothetical protein